MTRTEIVKANQELRAKDESHLWPISNRFNATDRAIRRVQVLIRQGLVLDDIDSYIAAVEYEIDEIVNNPDNW